MDYVNMSLIRSLGAKTVGCVAGMTLLVLAAAAFAVMVSACTDPLADAAELERQGDLQGALTAYRTMLEKEPDNVEALSGTAVCLLLLGRHNEALAFQERLVALDEDDVQTRIELGFNYLNHQGRPQDAARVLGEAALLEPSAKNLCFLAQAQVASGDVVGAEESLRSALESDAGYAYSYDQLIRLLENQGRVDEARQIAEQARAHGVAVENAQ